MQLRPTQIRAELPGDVDAIREVTAAAFRTAPHAAPPVEPGGPPGEAPLVDWLRADEGWIPELSLVAVEETGAGERVVGHAMATRGYVDAAPALAIGPVSVDPARQRTGIGSALVRALLERSADRGEPLVVLLGDPGYYGRFGFRPAIELGVAAPEPAWGGHFQAVALAGRAVPTGTFRYAAPFERL